MYFNMLHMPQVGVERLHGIKYCNNSSNTGKVRAKYHMISWCLGPRLCEVSDACVCWQGRASISLESALAIVFGINVFFVLLILGLILRPVNLEIFAWLAAKVSSSDSDEVRLHPNPPV